jgi:carbamoyltransferase
MNRLHQITGSDNLVMAGGCALNGVTNARILRDTAFSKQYLQCAASDDGTCIGAAYYCWHAVLGEKKRFEMTHAYWGPEYPTEHLRRVAEGRGHPVSHYEDEQSL